MTTLLHVSLFLLREGRVLLVQEGDPEDGERWNLPGGHVEPGEPITVGAIREAWEETSVPVVLTGLVGVYASAGTSVKRAVRFVFRADAGIEEAVAGEDILSVRWFSAVELAALPDDRLLGVTMLRRILADGFAGVSYPLEVLSESSGEK